MNVRDADTRGFIDSATAQVLDVVEFGKLASIVGCGELLKLVEGLQGQVVAIDQEEDTLGIAVFDQAVDSIHGGIGLATTGRHLDQRALTIFLEGVFQVGDGLDLTIAQARGF